MCEVKLHVKLPVFVARQWIRHRTANVNEYSARYSILDREFYVPQAHDLAAQSRVNNQGRGAVLEGAEAARVLDWLREDADRAYDHYEAMIGETGPDGEAQLGLARELARMNLPANVYTQWYWKVDLHNLFHFLRLRADAHAQMEIRVYADALCDIVRDWVPAAYGAFEDYRLGGAQLSRARGGVPAPDAGRGRGDAGGERDEQGGVAGVHGRLGVRRRPPATCRRERNALTQQDGSAPAMP